jgi:hypothetical protein
MTLFEDPRRTFLGSAHTQAPKHAYTYTCMRKGDAHKYLSMECQVKIVILSSSVFLAI